MPKKFPGILNGPCTRYPMSSSVAFVAHRGFKYLTFPTSFSVFFSHLDSHNHHPYLYLSSLPLLSPSLSPSTLN